VYMLLRKDSQLFVGAWSGLAFGIAVVTKENAIFFAPSMLYLLVWRSREDANRRFALMMWIFTASTSILLYFLLSTLKGELLPAGFDFSLSHSPQGHVSLLYEMWYQMHRTEGALFTKGSFLYSTWLPKDRWILGVGTVAMAVSLLIGWRERHRNPAMLVAGTLSLEIAFYLARGSVLLDFYVIPLLPLFALNIGMVTDRIFKSLSLPVGRVAAPVICACAAVLLALPTGGYLVKHGMHRQLQPADAYFVPETYMQNEQIAWIRAHIPTNATIVSDDDIWVAMHDVRPIYPYDQSHWNAASDPQIRNNLFHANWRNIDYIVLSNGMKHAMNLNNGNGDESYILTALSNSVEVWSAVHGDVSLAIYKVQNLPRERTEDGMRTPDDERVVLDAVESQLRTEDPQLIACFLAFNSVTPPLPRRTSEDRPEARDGPQDEDPPRYRRVVQLVIVACTLAAVIAGIVMSLFSCQPSA
jgi:hypothetical protein